MASHQSFILDQYRPDGRSRVLTAAQLETQQQASQALRGVIHEVVATHDAVSLPGKRFVPNTPELGIAGVATEVQVFRVHPPMTPEEARQIGADVVSAWNKVASTMAPPVYCDTVFPLPG